jgi:hypothetical protein
VVQSGRTRGCPPFSFFFFFGRLLMVGTIYSAVAPANGPTIIANAILQGKGQGLPREYIPAMRDFCI